MIRKSVETRDWLNTIEPRNIRSVMKRVVEEVTVIDKQVGTLYEDGVKRDQGSGQFKCLSCMTMHIPSLMSPGPFPDQGVWEQGYTPL